MKDLEKIIIPIIVIMFITVFGCYLILNEYSDKSIQIKKGITSEGEELVSDKDLKYESMGVLLDVNKAESILKFGSVDGGRVMELNYDSKMKVLGRHDNVMTLDQLPLGEILDITYSVHSDVVDTIQVSNDAWTQTEVRRFEINPKSRTMEIANNLYRMDDSVVVSYGAKLAELIDVTSVDTLIVKGVDKRVCSIIVEKGHGYLRLANDEYFQGGWIEVGQEVIKPVSARMLLPVPEGDYKVRVTNHGYAGEEEIVIERDKETEVDLSKIDIKEVAIGHILFDITPNYAQLSVDGEATDFEDRVPLEYGVHKVHVELAGYESVDTSIRVASEYADVSITLDKLDDSGSSSSSSTQYSIGGTSSSSTASIVSTTASKATSSSVTSSSTSTPSGGNYSGNHKTPPMSTTVYGNTSSSSGLDFPSDDTSSTSKTSSSSLSSSGLSDNTVVVPDKNVLYIDGPSGAQVYIDGVYIGIAPCECDKVTGTHIFTLAKDGYVTKSYTEYIDDDGKSVTLSFSELESVESVEEEAYSMIDEYVQDMRKQMDEAGIPQPADNINEFVNSLLEKEEE